MHPIDILIRSIIQGTGGGSGYADTPEAHNEKWLQSHGTGVYLKSLEGQSWDSTYFGILSSILTGNPSPESLEIPYTEDSYVLLYSEVSGVFYFWMPFDGSRLKVYEDSGLVVFEQVGADEFSLQEDLNGLEQTEENLGEQIADLEDETDVLWDAVYGKENYGFHIDSSESDPANCVTYIGDAVGMIPAHMDFTNDTFVWGSWKNAFFIPRPCMLKYDGTVDYYLDPDDYTKKEDGTASDVSDVNYWGNAMMEWGRDNKIIWYKIIPDTDPTSASVYVAPYQVDSGYKAWSFINNQGNLVKHFYTPIYNGSLDSNGKLRSISGKTYSEICQGKTVAQEVTASELNNPSSDKLWYTEVYSDITLINILLILMGKSLNTQAVFGNGVQGQASAASSMISTGTMDTKGLFWGDDDNTHGIKVFGIENWWGNQNHRFAGLVMIDYSTKYKMTRGTEDGSTATDYNTDGTGYLAGNTAPNSSNFVKKMQFDGKCFLPNEVPGSSSTYLCDYWYQNSGTRYPVRGGSALNSEGVCGSFCVSLSNLSSHTVWNYGSSPSCKPLSSKYLTLGYSSIVSFLHDGNYTLKDVKSKIVPVQDLHGQSSPYPPGGGKNKLPYPYYSADGVLSGITFSTDSDGKVTATGTTDAGVNYFLARDMTLQSGTYTVSITGTHTGLTLIARDPVNSVILGDITPQETSTTFTITETTSVRLYLNTSIVGASVSISAYIQLEVGSSPTSWTPYSNICPITGYNGVNVTRAGKNLLDGNYTDGYYSDSDFTIGGGANVYKSAKIYLKTGTYILSSTDATATIVRRILNGSYSAAVRELPITFTVSEDGYFGFSSGYLSADFQIELGSTATSYESYQGTTYPISFSSAGTVYGGTLDVTTGLLTVTMAEKDMGTLGWGTSSDRFNVQASKIIPAAKSVEGWSADNPIAICSIYKYGKVVIGSGDDKVIGFYSGALYARDTEYNDSTTFKTAMSGVRLVYEIATPITYQLTPTQISTLRMNNIWSDTGDTQVTYPLIERG